MYPTVNPKKCNGCGNCADICPSEVFEMEGDQANAIRPGDCIECWACVSQCPAEAVDLQRISRCIGSCKRMASLSKIKRDQRAKIETESP